MRSDRRTENAVEEIFAVLANNARDIWATVGFAFVVNRYGRVDVFASCGATITSVWWPLPTELVLCLDSIEQLEGEEARRIKVKMDKEPMEAIALRLRFRQGRLELIEEYVEDAYYWEEARAEYRYRIVPASSSDDIVAYAVLIPNRAVIPVDTQQLSAVISTVITDEEDKPVRL